MDLNAFCEDLDATQRFASQMAFSMKRVVSVIRDYMVEDNSLTRKDSEISGKALLKIDLMAEEKGREFIKDALTGHPIMGNSPLCGSEELIYYGEESIDDRLDFSEYGENRVVVLVDMIDGTDLLERGLQNWCSAAIVFYPHSNVILGSFVGTEGVLPGYSTPTIGSGTYKAFRFDSVYYAHVTPDPASQPQKMININLRPEIILKPSFYKRTIADASLAFYGQKGKNLFSIGGNSKLLLSLSEDARVYNLAGIPMMMRMIDPVPGATRGIDAVIDVVGQNPHDSVPGLYIAMKAGAKAIALKTINACGIEEGKLLDETMLAKLLLRPDHDAHKIAYVVAPEEDLAKQLADLLMSHNSHLSEWEPKSSSPPTARPLS